MTDEPRHPTDGAVITPLISAERIQARVLELGNEIRRDLGPGELTLLCVLKGSFVFTADLARAIEGPVNVEFLGVASYGMSTESSGAVKITQDLASPIEGKDVVLVEDIIDTGLTLAYLMQILAARRPKRLRIASILEKPSGNSPVKADYTGFTVGPDFVVGYGLDWGERFRNLPFVGKVEAPPERLSQA
jgi:hypoxanthine phosphoribosyltransferase